MASHLRGAIVDYCPVQAIPRSSGLLGSSPAAAAAWISCAPSTAAAQRAVDELTAIARRYGGLFPETVPFAVVERLWVLASLVRVGLPAAAHQMARTWIADIYDPQGVRGAPGLPVDADDTAVALHVAAALGVPRDPAPLSPFENASHFACYLGEDTDSVSPNAHILQALTNCGSAFRDTARKVRTWLLDRQHPDGYWIDKWHASPYYATAHCVEALSAHPGDRTRHALTTAARWVRDSRRSDGRWGVWTGTAEESAYAIQILLRDPLRTPGRIDADAIWHDPNDPHPALWHDKTLYTPRRIIEAELAATSAQLAAQTDQGQHRDRP